METNKKLQQNLDTNFLKLIAVTSMVIDHAGKIFFPDNMIMGIMGRIAFPLFAYCLAVGFLYTRDLKKYILRLLIFAVLSQPLRCLAFHPEQEQFWREILTLNILFTLIAGLLALKALANIKRNWWLLLITVAMELFLGLDYGFYGIVLIIIFCLCRDKSWLSALWVIAWTILWTGFGDFVHIGAIGLDKQFFSLLALPLIYIHTDFNPKIHKYFFYAFYPAHFLILFLIRVLLGV